MERPTGLLGAALTGVALAGILWANVNARRVRGFNLVSLALFVVMVGGLELLARRSQAAEGWAAGLGWDARFRDAVSGDPRVQAEIQGFSDLEEGRHRAYPDRGYPVAYGPRQAPVRVVCMGGSSTGGAFQYDDLSRFYPARLDALLGPDVEVLNQGVGGWTTFHVARYLSRHLDTLQPDVLTLYVSSNDAATGYPATLAELYSRWKGAPEDDPLHRILGRSALGRWVRVAALPAAAGNRAPAVSLPELRALLDEIQRAVAARGGRTLLVGEARIERAAEQEAYHEVMRASAAAHEGSAYLHGPDVFAGDRRYFLDMNHLTDEGHGALARALARTLVDTGMVPGNAAEGAATAPAPR